jgi:hypothetical protein
VLTCACHRTSDPVRRPTMVGLSVSPTSAALTVREARQFVATATMSDGTTRANPTVTWTATGGTVTTAGLYTAGAAAGSFMVAARTAGFGATTSIRITRVPPAPPPTSAYAYPLRAGPTGRYLVDQAGKPFFLTGDAAWSLIAQLSDQDADTYLSNRQQLGFTLVLVNLMEHQFSTNAPADIYGLSPFTGKAFTTPNEAYFAHADYIIQSAAQKGIVVLLAPDYLGYGCGSEGWCAETQAATTAEMRAWGQYVGARYKNYDNIVWLIGGDMDPTPVLANVQAMVDGLLSVDTRHPFTAHNVRGQMAITPWSGAAWLTVNNTYTNGVSDYLAALTAYNASPTLPFFLIESLYDGYGVTAQQLRSQSYWTVLSGGFGHVYGACPIWYFGAPSAQAACLVAGWQSQLSNQGALNMSYLRRLFDSRNWSTLVPDASHVALTAGFGTSGQADYATAAYGSDGSSIIAYLPTSRTVTVSGSRLAGSAMTAWWYNPGTGVATLIGTYPTSGTPTFTPPASGDWVLVVDAATFTFSAPGGGTISPR